MEHSQFPIGGIDSVQHDLRVLMTSESGFEEVLELSGSMILQRSDPYMTKDDRRVIDFKVMSWVATGWSEKLGAVVSYVLTEGEDQPISTIEAEQPKQDFPASFNFNVLFDVRLNNETVFRKLHGRPEGTHFRQVPPTGDRALSPTITRFTDVNQVTVKHPEFGEIFVKPLDCNDREGRILREMPGRKLWEPFGLNR